jgi:penicillin amidase
MLGQATKPMITWLSRRRLPQLNGRIYLDGLHEPVKIERDQWGIPHIQAANRKDLLFAQAFVHAQDRLWQMELNRRAATGELSAVFGRRTLELDRLSRTLGFARLARASWERLDEGTRSHLEAYSEGVNAFLQSRPQLPIEFSLVRHRPAPWHPLDCLAFARLQMWALSHGAMGEITLARLIDEVGEEKAGQLNIDYGRENPVTLPGGIELNRLQTEGLARPVAAAFMGKGALDGCGRGSNAWVIASGRSGTGHPILCNDMHLPVGTPSLWYYLHLRSDEGLHVAGFSQPGLPFVLVGHNEHVAWGATLSYTDCEDLFVERIRKQDTTQYLFADRWLEAEVIEEPIKVRWSQERIERVTITHHGPVVSDVIPADGQVLALSSMALKVDAAFGGFAQLNEAKDWDEFVLAVSAVESPSLNLLYADTGGNIGHYVSGKVPVRAKGDGSRPAPGWTAEHEWIGEIPFSEMPHALNPRAGYIVSANHRIVGDAYHHFLGKVWRNGYRARRIGQLIANIDRITLEDCQRFQLDFYSVPGAQLVSELADFRAREAEAELCLQLLREWDGWLRPESAGGAVFEVLLARLADEILSPHLARDLSYLLLGSGPDPLFAPVNEFHGYWPSILMRLLGGAPNDWIPDRQALLEDCLIKAARELRHLLGEDPRHWQWGRLHRIRFVHSLGMLPPMDVVFNQGPFPIGGDTNTVAQTGMRPELPYDNNAISISGRLVIDMGDLDHGRAMYAPGQSGHLGSPYYGNMIEAWLKGEYFKMVWSTEEVTAASENRLTLVPTKAEATG